MIKVFADVHTWTPRRQVNNLKYANGIDMLSDTQNDLRRKLATLDVPTLAAEVEVNSLKTKTMVMGQQGIEQRLVLKDVQLLENISVSLSIYVA